MPVALSASANLSHYRDSMENQMQMPLLAMEGFKFGCDPELFVSDPNGRPVSAEGLLPGTKDNPYKVDFGAVQVDGMAAEFNTDPAHTFEEFNHNIVNVIRQLKGMLPTGYKLLPVPSIVFDKEVWDLAPENAKELGCSPDFNAWTGSVNPPPHDPDNPMLRTASGHLHIGWTDEESTSDLQHVMNCRDLVKQLDWYLGGWSLKMDPDPTRRRLYGQAGACRYKPYGVEYRVLSNFWLSSKDRRLTVWNRMQMAIDNMRTKLYMPDKANGVGNEALIHSINFSERNELLERQFSFPLLSCNKLS